MKFRPGNILSRTLNGVSSTINGSVCRLSVCSALALTCATSPALAAAVLFAPDGGNGTGSINAAMPLAKLSSITLPRGRALIKGDSITVSIIPEWQFDRVPVLAGTVLDTRMISNGTGSSTVAGVAIFTQGDWLRYLDAPGAIETVQTNEKELSGRIISISSGTLSIATPSGALVVVPLADVQDIHSPRVFHFSIPTSGLAAEDTATPYYTQANTIVLQSTERPLHLKALKQEVARQSADGDVSTRKLVFIGTTLSLLNLAQIAPLIAIPLANAPALRSQAFHRELPFLLPSPPVSAGP